MNKYANDELREKYKVLSIRRILNDGNDFYRAVYYGYFEKIIMAGKEALDDFCKLYFFWFNIYRLKLQYIPLLSTNHINKFISEKLFNTLSQILAYFHKSDMNTALLQFYTYAVLDDAFDQVFSGFL